MRIFLSASAALLACLVFLSASSPVAYAQASDAERDQSGVIEEIVVTSRRRNESQQDVPLSVTAFGAEAINQLKPTTLQDLDSLAPNLYIGNSTAGPGASALFIRGVGYADIEKTQSPQVGVIVDGIQIGSSTGQLIDVFDVESIEVNRGPQGVLFGKNTIGGNIVVNRVRPNFEGFNYRVSAQAGNFDATTLKARFNVPLTETLALKVGAIERDADGFYDNDALGGNVGDVDFSSQTLALRFAPNDRFDAILTYDRIDDQSDTQPQDPRFDGDDRLETLANKDEPSSYEVDQLGLRIDWDINENITLHSITGFHDSEESVNQDFDSAGFDSLSIPFVQLHTLREQEFDVFTQELRIDVALNENVDLMFGFYYFDSELEFEQRSNNQLQLPPVVFAPTAPPGTPCAAFGANPNPILGDAVCQLPPTRTQQLAGEDVESLAFFGSVNWRPTEQLELSLGIRSLEEDKDARNSYFGFEDGTFNTGPFEEEFDFTDGPVTSLGNAFDESDSWDDVIITASANYAFNDSSRIYFSYSEGFRSGGFSIRSARFPGEEDYQPEEAVQYEIGVKNDLFDRRLRLNASVFLLQRQDQQINAVIPITTPPGTTTLVNTGGDIDITGIEIEGQWAINNNWSLLFNYGFLDTDEESFALDCFIVDNCVTADPTVFDPVGTPRQLGGGDDSPAPDFNANISLSYVGEIGPGVLSANIGYTRVGEFLLVETGGGANQQLFQDDYSLLNARIGYDLNLDSGVLSFNLFGKNLTDEDFFRSALFLGGPTTGFQDFGAPRVYALEVQFTSN